MPPRESGKQRASRIPLDYYKRPNRMERWKSSLALLALLVTVGVTAGAWALRDGGKPFITRGPVASVHAAWDDKCEACHASFNQISKGSATSAILPNHTTTVNGKCQNCHDGTKHHENELDSMTPTCGGCHRDHRGREAALNWLPDSDCTQCHGNLKASSKDSKENYANVITAFADKSAGHPEFRSLAKDPGRLKFNHRLHMMPGQVAEADAAKPWTLGRITDKATRERYAGAAWQTDKSDGAAVVLDCASCHRLDAGDFGIDPAKAPDGVLSSALTPRAAGRYMLPVNYEIHCNACHPLTFDPKVKGSDGQPLSVPHHVQPDAVKDVVWGAYAALYGDKTIEQRAADAAKAAPQPSRPLPGKLTAAEQLARESIGKDAKLAEDFLFKSDVQRADGYLTTGKSACGECHIIDTAGGTKKIQPLMVNNVWLAHAKFSHVAHRAYDCRGCHPNAYAMEADNKTPNKTASTVHSDVLILGIDSCRQCHAPAAGVRSDCSECHLYHNGDNSLQGLGAAVRNPRDKDAPKGEIVPRRFSDVKQFLTGTRD